MAFETNDHLCSFYNQSFSFDRNEIRRKKTSIGNNIFLHDLSVESTPMVSISHDSELSDCEVSRDFLLVYPEKENV